MTEKQLERAVAVEADIFEKEVRNSIGGSTGIVDNPNITFKEFSHQWLEKVKRDHSITYYYHSVDLLKEINESIGGYKMKDITPAILQSYYDKLDAKIKVSIKVVPKPGFRQNLYSRGLNFVKLRDEYRIQNYTLGQAMNGKPVSKAWSMNFAERVDIPFEELFDEKVIEEKYAYETIHEYKRTIRTIFSLAKKNRIVVDNYASAEYINFPKKPSKQIQVMDDESAKKLFETAMVYPNIKAKTAILLLLFTGFRRGELAGLEWSDIDFKNNTITINRSIVTTTHHGAFEKEPKTEKSRRTITMAPTLVDILLEYKKWQDNYKEMVGDYFQDTDKVFTQDDGKNINPSTFTGWLNKLLKVAELDHYTLHSIRHTNITMQIAAGVPIVTVSARAGHARTSTTTDIYAHFIRSSDQQAANIIDSIFNEGTRELPSVTVNKDTKIATINKIPGKVTQKSDVINAYRKAKEDMERLGFKSYDEYLDYLEFVETKNKRDIEIE